MSITKSYLDKNGLQYLISKIKGEYHKVKQSSTSTSTNYPILLGGNTNPNGSALTTNYDTALKYNPNTDTMTVPYFYAQKIYQNNKQTVDTIIMNGSTVALTNSSGTVTIPTIAGEKGATGIQGVTGLKGNTGPTGQAAGFGTPTGKINALGPTAAPTITIGTTGPNTAKVFNFTFGFPQGLQGVTGSKGKDGVQGVTGDKGSAGPRGITGPQGDKGVQGLTGTKGINGVQGLTGARGVTGSTGPQGARGVQGKTGAAGFITSIDRSNFTEANWNTYGTTGHQESWSNTTIPSGMQTGDLFVIIGCATDSGKGHQLVYRYDATYLPTNTTLRGTCVSHSVIAYRGATGIIGPTGKTGATGATGLKGDTGPKGITGIRGSLIYGGSGSIESGTGIITNWTVYPDVEVHVGDRYISSADSYIYTCKTGGSMGSAYWTRELSIKGATGPTGPQGVTGLQGVTGPQGEAGSTPKVLVRTLEGSITSSTTRLLYTPRSDDDYLISLAPATTTFSTLYVQASTTLQLDVSGMTTTNLYDFYGKHFMYVQLINILDNECNVTITSPCGMKICIKSSVLTIKPGKIVELCIYYSNLAQMYNITTTEYNVE